MAGYIFLKPKRVCGLTNRRCYNAKDCDDCDETKKINQTVLEQCEKCGTWIVRESNNDHCPNCFTKCVILIPDEDHVRCQACGEVYNYDDYDTECPYCFHDHADDPEYLDNIDRRQYEATKEKRQ